MTTKCRGYVYRRFDEVWRIVVESINWVISNRPDPHSHARPLVIKLAPAIIDTIKCVFTRETAKEYPVVLAEKTLNGLYELLRKVNVLLYTHL